MGMLSRMTNTGCLTGMMIMAVGCVSGPSSRVVTTSPPPVTEVAENTSSGTDSTYIVQPPDVLQVAIVPEDHLTRNCMVRPDGYITFDLIGDIRVAGLTPPQIDHAITERLAEYIKNVEVAVSVEGTRSKQFYILGEVNRPGPNPLDGDISARDAIGLAGGFSRRASKSNIYVVRAGTGKRETIRVNVGAMLKTGDNSGNVMIRPDDIVLVKPNAFAKVGYVLDTVFYPFQGIFGMASQVGSTAYSVTSYPFTSGGRISGGRR